MAETPHQFKRDSHGGCALCPLEAEAHPPVLFRAVGESARFAFEAYGATPNEARAAYTRLMASHTRQFRTGDGWAAGMLADMRIYIVAAGTAFRDQDQVI
jgi:hypothetical protein